MQNYCTDSNYPALQNKCLQHYKLPINKIKFQIQSFPKIKDEILIATAHLLFILNVHKHFLIKGNVNKRVTQSIN